TCFRHPVAHLLSLSPILHHSVLPSFPTRRSSDLISALYHYFTCRTYKITADDTYIYLKKDGISPIHMPIHKSEIKGMLVEIPWRSEEHTSELQSRFDLVCRLLLEKNKKRSEDEHK